MSNLIVIDTSPRKDSVSRRLSERFIENWANAYPDARIVHRDVGANPPEHLDDELIDALRREPEKLSERQIAARQTSDAMIAELQDADVIVIGAPMHNFTITGAFRTWLDHIARPGRTFGYKPGIGPEGLLQDKPVYVLSSRGGKYGDGDPEHPHPADFQTGYIRHILGFMGLTDITVITANGMDMGDEVRAEGLAVAENKIDEITRAFAA